MTQRTLGILLVGNNPARGALVVLRFKILGRTALRFGDHQHFDEEWGHARLRGMLGALLLHPSRALPVAELIDWTWPDGKEPGDPVATLYSYARRVRQALRRMDSPPALISVDRAYRLVGVNQDEIDVFSFRALVQQARTAGTHGDHEQASRLLSTALELWTDRPLADLRGERAANWRHWADTELWLSAQDLLLRELNALGRFDHTLHRIAELPTTRQTNLWIVKRKVEALYGQSRYHEAKNYVIHMRRQLREAGDLDEADELLRFNDGFQPVSHAPVGALTKVSSATVQLLRRDIQDFIGREDLLSKLDEVTATPGVVVLEGTAGVGKTALAVHWAHKAASRYPNGVLYIDLGGFSDGARVEANEAIDVFLTALGSPPERIRGTAGRQAKLHQLTNRLTLAVLDNAIDSAHVEPVLDCLSGDCQVIVTSRRSLSGLARRGATNLTVPALTYPVSRQWLVRRLGERLAEAPEAADILAAICGGNLLALRVVAQHIATAPQVPVGDLVEELRDSRTLLSLGDDGDGPDSSVRATLAWSYRALATDDRRVFRLLGLHPGPAVNVDLAAALVGQHRKQTERSLNLLVHAHMLTRESRLRYRMHDLLRKFAAETIAADEHTTERAAAAERLLSYLHHTASNADDVVFPFRPGIDRLPLARGVVPLGFTSDEAAIDWCVQERANINAIIKFASENNFDAYVPKLAHATGEIFRRLGYVQDTMVNLLLGLGAARHGGDTEEEGNALNNIVHMALNNRDFATAESYLDAAEERYATIGYEIGLAVATHHRGRLCLERGEFARGIAHYQKSLAMLRRADAKGLEVTALYRLAEAYRRRQAFDEAASYCRDGLWLAERLHLENSQAQFLSELSMVYFEQGDVAAARGYAIRALELHEHQRDRSGAGKVSNLLAKLDCEQADWLNAERHARTALRLCRGMRDSAGAATAHDTLARVYHAEARHDDAARELTLALALFEDLGDPRAVSVQTRLSEIPDASPLVPEVRTEPVTPRRPAHHTDSSRS